MKNKKKVAACTFTDKVKKLILIASKDGKRFKYHCNKTQGLKLLQNTIAVLDQLEIEYYLDFGTLIGAMRDKGFIEWDDDVDISLKQEIDCLQVRQIEASLKKCEDLYISSTTFAQSIDNRKNKALKDNSVEIFVSNIDFTNEYNTRIIKVRHKNRAEKLLVFILNKLGQNREGGKCLDIFFKYKKGNQLIWMAQNKIHHIEADKLSNELIEIDFYNIKCKIPKNYDEYLTSMYGDWKTPKKDWQYYEEDMVTRK